MMTGSYALIQDGVVINTIVWDGPEVSPIEFPEGVTYVEFPDDYDVSPSIGWTYDGNVFTPPPVPEPSHEELVAEAQAKKQALLSAANTYTQPWQTQLLLGIITDADKASLTVWMKYYQQVQAIDTSNPSAIVWPETPKS
jgi:hypothetical protein